MDTNLIPETNMDTPDIANLAFVLHTPKTNVSIPIINPTQLWEHPQYNKNLPLVIFVTGWLTFLQNEPLGSQDQMAKAYLCRGNVNFVVGFYIYKRIQRTPEDDGIYQMH